MKYGISTLGVIPLRKEPSHRSEMTSQVLFGETYEIINHSSSWLLLKCSYDEYEGWIDQNQHSDLSAKDFTEIAKTGFAVTLDQSFNTSSGLRSIPITAGSSLPFFDGLSFRIGKEKFVYNGQVVPSESRSPALFERVALRYQNSPYLWGGRSPFGIDCSGFTQMVYKFTGVKLKRDAYQQAGQGSIVNLIEESRPGDLAFFGNEEGKIIHTGIILKDGRIIHASGKVRIDKIDHFGIYNMTMKKYSHQLKTIRRFF